MFKNGILWQILQAKRYVLTMSKRFEILYILSYLWSFCVGKLLAVALIIFLNFWKSYTRDFSQNHHSNDFFSFLRSYIFIIQNPVGPRIGCCITLARIMGVKINFTWIWAVIMDLEGYKVAPRRKNVVLVQVSSTKKTM